MRVRGIIKTAKLLVDADVTQFGYDSSRKHTVYLYIDNGVQGGHIGVEKRNNLIDSGDFYPKKDSPNLRKEYPLDSLPVSVSPNGSRLLNVIEILNNSQKHYIGAFVSTGIYGILKSMTIEYTCQGDESSCSIEVLE